MTDKLLNLNEVSEYLGITKEKVRELVDKGVIPAYKIAGSFLRFNKSEVDAAKDRILNQISTQNAAETGQKPVDAVNYSIGDKVADFIYFNDFYIISLAIIAVIIYIIFS